MLTFLLLGEYDVRNLGQHDRLLHDEYDPVPVDLREDEHVREQHGPVVLGALPSVQLP